MAQEHREGSAWGNVSKLERAIKLGNLTSDHRGACSQTQQRG
jgi:hypothetical protein